MRLNKVQKGISLTEYAFIAALVGVACIAVLSVLGQDVLRATQVIQNDVKMHRDTAQSAQARIAAEIAAENKALEEAEEARNSGLTSNNGSQVCQGSFCVRVSSALDTTGGNGATRFTDAAADTLSRIAQHLREQNADPTLIDLVTKLANSGHDFGDSQSKLWGCTSGSRCVASLRSSEAGIKSSVAEFNKLSSQLNSYLNSHPGSLTQSMASVIAYNSDQIKGIGKGYNIGGGSGGLDFSYSGNASATHKYSNNICDSGGNNCKR